MNKIFWVLGFVALFTFGGLIISKPAFAEENSDNGYIKLDPSTQDEVSKTFVDEDGKEATVSITEVENEGELEGEDLNNGTVMDENVFSTQALKKLDGRIRNKTYQIKFTKYPMKASFNMTVKNGKVSRVSNLNYSIPLITMNGYKFDKSDYVGYVHFDFSLVFKSVYNWIGKLEGRLMQGMVMVYYN